MQKIMKAPQLNSATLHTPNTPNTKQTSKQWNIEMTYQYDSILIETAFIWWKKDEQLILCWLNKNSNRWIFSLYKIQKNRGHKLPSSYFLQRAGMTKMLSGLGTRSISQSKVVLLLILFGHQWIPIKKWRRAKIYKMDTLE